MPTSPTWEDTEALPAPSWDETLPEAAPSKSDRRDVSRETLLADIHRMAPGLPMPEVPEDQFQLTEGLPPASPERLQELVAGEGVPIQKGARPLEIGGTVIEPKVSEAQVAIPSFQPPPEAGVAEKIAAGIWNVGATIPNFMLSPEGMATAVIPEAVVAKFPALAGITKAGVKGLFAGLAAKGAGEAAGRAVVTRDPQDITEAALTTGLAPLVAFAPEKGAPDARQVPETAAVHGNVPAQPVQGPGQVPVEGGGAGVRPPAEAVAEAAQVSLTKEQSLAQVDARITALENDPEVTGRKLVGMSKDGTPQYENVVTSMTKRIQLRNLNKLRDKIVGWTPTAEPSRVTAEVGGKPVTKGQLDLLSSQVQAAGKQVGRQPELLDNPPDPEASVPFANNIAYITPEGRLIINRKNLEQTLADIPQKDHARYIERLINEEHIHAFTSDTDALNFFNAATPAERALAFKQYTGFDSPSQMEASFQKALKPFKPLSNELLGKEMVRQRLQQLSRLGVREVVEVSGREKWSRGFVDALQRAVFNIRRKLLRTGASKTQELIIRNIQRNLDAAQESVTGEKAGEPAGAFKRRTRVGRDKFGGSPEGALEEEIRPGVFADKSIAPILRSLDQAGFKTNFSHSGLQADHPLDINYDVDQGYISFGKMSPGMERRVKSAALSSGLKFDPTDPSSSVHGPRVGIPSAYDLRGRFTEEPLSLHSDEQKMKVWTDFANKLARKDVAGAFMRRAFDDRRRYDELQPLFAETLQGMKDAMMSGDRNAMVQAEESRIGIQREIEDIKNRHGGVPPPEAGSPLGKLPAVPEGHVRLYHGEGAAEGAGKGTGWFTSNPHRAATFGGEVTYVDVPRRVATEGAMEARRSGSGTTGDVVVPPEVAKRAEPVKGVEAPVHEVGAFMRKAEEEPVRFEVTSGVRKGDHVIVTRDPATSLWRATLLSRSTKETRFADVGQFVPETHELFPTKEQAVRGAENMLYNFGVEDYRRVPEDEPLAGAFKRWKPGKPKAEPGQEMMFPKEMTAMGVPGEETTVAGRTASTAEFRKPFTPQILSNEAIAHLEEKDPSFKTFAERMGATYGVPRDALIPVYEDAVYKHLGKASGDRLLELARKVGAQNKLISRKQRESGQFLKTSEEAGKEGLSAGSIPDPLEQEQDKLVAAFAEELIARQKESQAESRRASALRAKLTEEPAQKELLPAEKPDIKKLVERQKEEARQRAEGIRTTRDTLNQVRKAAQSRQRMRSRIISTLARELLSEVITDDVPLNRTDVNIEDIDWHNPTVVEGPFYQFAPNEARSAETVARITADQSRRSNKDPVSVSKRLLVLVNPKNRRVAMVDAYPHGRSGLMVMRKGISAIGAEHKPLPEVMAQGWRPLYTILLQHPVKNFYKEFGDIRAFNDYINTEEATARNRVIEYGQFAAEGPPQSFSMPAIEGEERTPSEEPGMEEVTFRPTSRAEVTSSFAGRPSAKDPTSGMRFRAQFQGRGEINKGEFQPLNPREANALFRVADQFEVSEPADFKVMVDAIGESARQNRGALRGDYAAALSSLVKIARRTFDDMMKEAQLLRQELAKAKVKEAVPNPTEEQAYNEALNQVWWLIENNNGLQDFIARTVDQYGPLPEKGVSLGYASRPFAAAAGETGPTFQEPAQLSRPGELTGGEPMPQQFLPPYTPTEALPARPSTQEIALSARRAMPVPPSPRELEMLSRVPPTTVRPGQVPPEYVPPQRVEPPEMTLGRPGPSSPPELLPDPATMERLSAEEFPYKPTEEAPVTPGKPTGKVTEYPPLTKRGIPYTPRPPRPAQPLKLLGQGREVGAFFRGAKEVVEEEANKIARGVAALSKRGASEDLITATRDAASNLANNFGRKVANDIRARSGARKPGTIGERLTGSTYQGDKQVLAAANALVQSGFDQTKLPDFMTKVQHGIMRAQQLIANGDWHERIIGRKWLEAGRKLEQELTYAEAHWNDRRLQDTAKTMKRELDQQFDRELNAGSNIRYDEHYLPGRYEAEFFNDDAVVFGAIRDMLGRQWREPKTFASYYDAIEAGPYIARSRDGADIVGSRIQQGMGSINYQMWSQSIMNYTDPVTGQRIAERPVKRPDGSYAPTSSEHVLFYTRPGYEPLSLRQGFEPLLRDLTATSSIHKHTLGRNALELAQRLKHSILIGDFFHLGRVSYYAASIMRAKMGFRGGLAAIEYREQDLPRAVAQGLVSKRDADWATTKVPIQVRGKTVQLSRIAIAELGQRLGLNNGRIQDALYKDLVVNGLTEAVPGLKQYARQASRYNKWLFDRVSRGFITQAFVTEFERQNAAKPTIDAELLTRDIVKDTNRYFGNLGRQGWIRSASYRDAARLFFLAPQWVEGLVMKEAGLAARAAGAPLGYRAQYTKMGTLGRGMATGLFTMFALTQALNLIFRRKPTWENEEKGHKFDAFIPTDAKGNGLWLSPLAVFNELTHDVIRLMETKPTFWEVLTQIGENKLSPYGRIAMIGATMQTPYNQRITSTGGFIKEAAKQMAPVPISFGRPLQAAANLAAPSLVHPVPRGGLERQALGAIGFKTEPSQDKTIQLQGKADDFVKANGLKKETGWMQVQTDEPNYSKLRRAIRMGDFPEAKRQLDALRQGRTDEAILKAMRLVLMRPFAGSKANERLFLYSLKPEELELYNQAMTTRQEEYDKFIDWYLNLP